MKDLSSIFNFADLVITSSDGLIIARTKTLRSASKVWRQRKSLISYGAIKLSVFVGDRHFATSDALNQEHPAPITAILYR